MNILGYLQVVLSFTLFIYLCFLRYYKQKEQNIEDQINNWKKELKKEVLKVIEDKHQVLEKSCIKTIDMQEKMIVKQTKLIQEYREMIQKYNKTLNHFLKSTENISRDKVTINNNKSTKNILKIPKNPISDKNNKKKKNDKEAA